MTESPVDTKYYECVKPKSFAERLLVIARDRIYYDFMRVCQPKQSDTILDVGVSDVINDGANRFERRYPYPERVTAAGLGEGAAFREAFPEANYVRIKPNSRLPFDDRSFDIAMANAVLEHVGSRANQEFFIKEFFRVARAVFVSIPNRYFPVEPHTTIPFLHFWDSPFRLACKAMGKSEWALERKLILMSRKLLCELLPPGTDARVGYTGLPLGPLSSNLYVYARTRLR
jgi:Methyltransferase domain